MQSQLVAELLCLLSVGKYLVHISEMMDDVLHNVAPYHPNCWQVLNLQLMCCSFRFPRPLEPGHRLLLMPIVSVT